MVRGNYEVKLCFLTISIYNLQMGRSFYEGQNVFSYHLYEIMFMVR